MNYTTIKLLLLSFILMGSYFAQEINQQEAIKQFKKGKHKSWGAHRDNSVFEDGKVEINIKKNDDNEPIAVMLNTAEYHMNYITDYNSKYKIYTNTHFKFRKKSLCMVFYDERLFIFTIDYDGSFKAFNSVIGAKIKSFEPYVEVFKKHALEIEKVVKQKEAELEAMKKKSNPAKYYAKVYKISEGLKKTKDKDGKVGFLNSDNDVAIPFEYDDAYNYFNNGIIGVKKGKKYGYINKNNEVVIPINKDFVGDIHIDLILTEESDGTYNLHDLAGKVVKGSLDNAYWDKSLDAYYIREGKDHGYVQAGGSLTWVMQNRDYSEIMRAGKHYIVVKGNGTGLVDATSLKEILKPTYDMVYLLGVDVFGVEKNEKLGVYVPNKGFITEVVYDNLDVFENGKGQVESKENRGQVDLNGNIAWNDGRKTFGRTSSQPFDSWRANYSTSGVVAQGELTLVSKNNKYGYVNDKGELQIPIVYTSASDFKDGLASVLQNGEYFSINELNEKKPYKSGGNNSIEMSFDYAHSEGVNGHMGVVWDKKTGLNRVFANSNIYDYKFQGSKNFDLTPVQLAPLKDERGEIMMQALQYGAGFSPLTFRYKILVWNTYSGKYIVFEYNQKTNKFEAEIVEDGSNLRDSWLKSEKGGRIMIDYLYFYQDDKRTKTKLVGWNTLTGKSTYGDIKIPNYNPEVDGEIMVESFLFSDGDVFSIEYTTKTLKKESHSLAEKGSRKYSESGVDFDVDKTSEHQVMFKYIFGKYAEMMIFEQSTLNNSTGLKRSSSLYLYENLVFDKEDYSSLQRKYSDEIGVIQIGSHTGKKLEYLFWNKSSGHFSLFTYQKGSPSRFVPSVGVYENLLDLKPGQVPQNIIKGEALTKYVAPKETNTTSSNSSSTSSSSSSSSSSNSPKLVQVQVNPNGKAKNFVHIHWTENGSSKKKSLQAKSTGSIGKIPEGTKLYYSTDNDSKKTFFYEVPTGKSSASVTIK